MYREKTKTDEYLTLRFKGKKVRIKGEITCCWLAADDIYTILGKGEPEKKAEIDGLIEAGVEINSLSTADIGIVINLAGLVQLVEWAQEVNESRAAEFREWIFNEMFPRIWSWTSDNYSRTNR
jgi:prophage antirepressor-like protein